MSLIRLSIVILLVALAGCRERVIVTQTIGDSRSVNQVGLGIEPPRLIKMGIVDFPNEAVGALIAGNITALVMVNEKGEPTKVTIESRHFTQFARDTAGNFTPMQDVSSIVEKDGTITTMSSLFDQSAINAMMHSRFDPQKVNGVPTSSVVRIPVVFNITQRH